MFLRLLRFLMAGLLFTLAVGAQAQGQAQEPKRWYVAGGVGATWIDDLTFTGASTGEISMDTGYTGNVSIGRYLDDIRVIRLEIEGLGAKADVNNTVGFKIDGDVAYAGVMLNFLYDIRTGSPWTPFLGGGIGWSQVWANDISDTTGTALIDGNDQVFSYQFKGGVAYEFNDSWSATVLYRYFLTDNLGFEGTSAAPGTAKSDGIRSSNLEFGVKLNF